MGLSEPDDAGVYQLNDEQAVVLTTDFFTPVVDDPYDFGAIAAANALSDVYAMGGNPLFALNLVAYPDGLGLDLLTEILRGGAEKAKESGTVIVGGHTITDKEPKYGLAVVGLVHPQKVTTKRGAQPGDQLILTKALGTGVITTGLKQDKATDDHLAACVASMSQLNQSAAQVALEYGVHAMTDITGYGFIGHAHEMLRPGEIDFHFDCGSFKWLPGALTYAEQELFPGGMWRNRDYYLPQTRIDDRVSEPEQLLLFDPQTSGGILMAVSAEKAVQVYNNLHASGHAVSIVGEVTTGEGLIHVRA